MGRTFTLDPVPRPDDNNKDEQIGGGGFARDPGPRVQTNAKYQWDEDGKRLWLVATETIYPDTEIFYRYPDPEEQGPEWRDFPIVPISLIEEVRRSIKQRQQPIKPPNPSPASGWDKKKYMVPVLQAKDVESMWPLLQVKTSKDPVRGQGLFAKATLPIYTKIPYLGTVLDFRDQLAWILVHVFGLPPNLEEKKTSVSPSHAILAMRLDVCLASTLQHHKDPRGMYGIMRDADHGTWVFPEPEQDPLAIASRAREPHSHLSEKSNMILDHGFFVTTRKIAADEELLWCHGPHTHRKMEYVTACSSMLPRSQQLKLSQMAHYIQQWKIPEHRVQTQEALLKWLPSTQGIDFQALIQPYKDIESKMRLQKQVIDRTGPRDLVRLRAWPRPPDAPATVDFIDPTLTWNQAGLLTWEACMNHVGKMKPKYGDLGFDDEAGTQGSMTAHSAAILFTLFSQWPAETFFDAGAADGYMLMMAACTAQYTNLFGVELKSDPNGILIQRVQDYFDAIPETKVDPLIKKRNKPWIRFGTDAGTLTKEMFPYALNNVQSMHFFTFWQGFPPDSKEQILKVVQSWGVKVFACGGIHNDAFGYPEDVLDILVDYDHVATIHVKMMGSHQSKQVMVFVHM